MTGIDLQLLSFTYQENIIDPENTIIDLHIQDNDVIHVVVRKLFSHCLIVLI